MIIWKLRALFITRKKPVKKRLDSATTSLGIFANHQFIKIHFQTFLQNYIEMFLKIISNEIFFSRSFYVFKVRIFWEGHKILQNLHLTFDCGYVLQSKVRWRFRKILWPSQNIWTTSLKLVKVSFSTKSIDFQKYYALISFICYLLK